MDANGQRFWMLAAESDWTLLSEGADASGAAYDRAGRVLRLASRREGLDALEPGDPETLVAWRAAARAQLAQVPDTRDRHGSRAWWVEAERRVRATGPLTDSVPIVSLPAEWGEVTDLAVGYDDVLYVAVGGDVVLHDLRDRWDPAVVRAPDLHAWRMAAHPDGGVLVLDAEHRSLWRVRGTPLPARPPAEVAPTVIRPCCENADPPRAEALLSLAVTGAGILAGLAVSPAATTVVLTWTEDTGRAYAHLVDFTSGTLRRATLDGACYPYSCAWTALRSEPALALLVPALAGEALVYLLGEASAAEPVGDFFPLSAYAGGPFLNAGAVPLHYPIVVPEQDHPSAPLLPIAAASSARAGRVQCRIPCDSGSTRTAWHRLYLEACFPPGCGARVLLAVTNTPVEPPASEDEEWHEHLFGDVAESNPRHPAAHAAWLPQPSELPFHPGLVDRAELVRLHGKRRVGLFSALIQRPNRPVRALRGRYLWVRIELLGGGRSSPAIAAVRAYASRFSYVEHYLPELYHEQELGADADHAFAPIERATTTPADFLERLLGAFESVLTPLEDRIANAYLLTDPRTVPAESLAWLASWVGLALDTTLPVQRQRAMLAAAAELAREHGTYAGLARALDLATGGAYRRGEIVIVEDFRLRRTMATILGVDLAHEEDPMLAGLSDSGNSIVGDTLVLGQEHRKEFLALFGADLPTTAAETAAVQLLFERLAHRVTILVHNEVEPQDLGLIRRVVAAATPTHVEARVLTARYPFMVGIASLVRVDTYLGPPSERSPVVVNRSALGTRDYLLRASTLDPRLRGASAPTGDRLTPVHA